MASSGSFEATIPCAAPCRTARSGSFKPPTRALTARGVPAQVTVRAGGHQQLQEVRSGGGYVSQSDFRLHFGLGATMKIDVLEIRWPSGLVQNLENIPANQILLIKEGVGIVKY